MSYSKPKILVKTVVVASAPCHKNCWASDGCQAY